MRFRVGLPQTAISSHAPRTHGRAAFEFFIHLRYIFNSSRLLWNNGSGSLEFPGTGQEDAGRWLYRENLIQQIRSRSRLKGKQHRKEGFYFNRQICDRKLLKLCILFFPFFSFQPQQITSQTEILKMTKRTGIFCPGRDSCPTVDHSHEELIGRNRTDCLLISVPASPPQDCS